MKAEYLSETGYLRRASEQDTDLLFRWVNEKAVREHSFSGKLITYEEHRSWLRQILRRDDIVQYIYMRDGQAVGQVRIRRAGIEAEISYSICAEKRRMGYGSAMLVLLQKQVRQDFPEVKKLTAKVKPENTASHKVFLDIGYKNIYSYYEMEIDTSVAVIDE